MSSESLSFNWSCKHTWKRSAKNTAWCLLGCSIGDFGTILFFQLTKIPFPVLGIMTLAIINGLITSIILETIILMKQNFEDNYSVYELVTDDHHDHMVCLDTGDVIEFTDDIIEERQKKLAKEKGYEIIDHSMVLYVKPLKD